MPRRSAALVVTLTMALVAAACSEDDTEDSPPAATRLRIVASTSIVGDIVEHVAGRGSADVEVLMPRGADPHAFELSARQVATMRDADLVVVNGLGLEPNLDDTLDATRRAGVPIFSLAEAADPLPFEETLGSPPEHADEEHTNDEGPTGEGAADGGGELDPHVWFDPLRVADAVRALGQSLDEIEPSVDWSAQARGYATTLSEQLHGFIEGSVATIPPERRRLVTNHEVLGYFARRYGFEVLAAVIPGGSTLAEPSARDLAELVELLRTQEVPAIFAETSSPNRLARALRREVGESVEVVTLFTESLGDPGSEADSYVGLMRENTRLIVEALR